MSGYRPEDISILAPKQIDANSPLFAKTQLRLLRARYRKLERMIKRQVLPAYVPLGSIESSEKQIEEWLDELFSGEKTAGTEIKCLGSYRESSRQDQRWSGGRGKG
jgi:hypothetical protein